MANNDAGQQGSQVARRYAQALLELADDQQRLDEVAGEVADLGRLLDDEPQFERLMATPAVNVEQRGGIIERVFEGRVSDTFHRFLQVVNRKGRSRLFRAIVSEFRELLDRKRGIVKVQVTTPAPLGEDEADRIANAIGQAMGGRHVALTRQTNPAIIGGLRIRVGDQLIDASVATQLRRMRDRLVEAGYEKAKSGARG